MRRRWCCKSGLAEKDSSSPAGRTGHHQGPEDEARHYQRQPCTVCKTSIPGSNPGGASNLSRSIPAAWVAVKSLGTGNRSRSLLGASALEWRGDEQGRAGTVGRLAAENARTCRHFGVSRKTFYKWKKRYDTDGPTGLCDRARRPHHSPGAFSRDIVSKILYLRQNYLFGPGRIADYLRRFHDIVVAVSSVHRVLLRHGMNRLPANQKHRAHTKRWQRYEKPQPGHRLQMDVKFLERIPGTRKRLYQFTAIDDCTRIRVLKVYDACNQAAAISFMNEVLRRLPFRVLVVQTDKRRRIPVALSLASGSARHPPRLHPSADAASQWESGAVTPGGRPGVLSAPRPGRGERRHSPLQREAQRVGGLLKLPPAAWGAGRPNPLRAAGGKNEGGSVTSVLGTYTQEMMASPPGPGSA